MPPNTDHIEAIVVIFIQLCFLDSTIGANNASVGIGKMIDSKKLKALRYITELFEPQLSIITEIKLLISFYALK